MLKPLLSIKRQFIQSEDNPGSLVLRTIERADSLPWISGAALEPESLGKLELVDVEEGREPDPTLCRRLYRFEILPGGLAPGTYTGALRLRINEAEGPPPDSAEVSIEVLSRLAFIPPRIECVAGLKASKPQSVMVVDRLMGSLVSVVDFDEETLAVRPADAGPGQCVFEIQARSDAATGCSEVTFSTPDGWRDTLLVQIGR